MNNYELEEEDYGDEWWFGGTNEGQIIVHGPECQDADGFKRRVKFVSALYKESIPGFAKLVREMAVLIASAPTLAAEVERLRGWLEWIRFNTDEDDAHRWASLALQGCAVGKATP